MVTTAELVAFRCRLMDRWEKKRKMKAMDMHKDLRRLDVIKVEEDELEEILAMFDEQFPDAKG